MMKARNDVGQGQCAKERVMDQKLRSQIPRRHETSPRSIRNLSSTPRLSLICLICCWIAVCSAVPSIYIEEEMLPAPEVQSLIDIRPTPTNVWKAPQTIHQRDVFDNQDATPTESSAKETSTSSADDSSSTSDSSSDSNDTATPTKLGDSTGTLAANTISASSSALPTILDNGFSANATSSCSNFIESFLGDATFQSCLPISLLLQNSNSFFQASKSIVSITQVLDASCKANSTACNQLMSNLGGRLSASSNCASDIASENNIVTGVLQGLQAYQTLYTASCLKNPDSGAYCYAEAITNSTNPTDSYLYYLPLNTSLPSAGQPSCGSCTKDTMGIFEVATSNRSNAIAYTYGSAATQTNAQCGQAFVNATLAQAVKGWGVSQSQSMLLSNGGLLALVVLVSGWFL